MALFSPSFSLLSVSFLCSHSFAIFLSHLLSPTKPSSPLKPAGVPKHIHMSWEWGGGSEGTAVSLSWGEKQYFGAINKFLCENTAATGEKFYFLNKNIEFI